MKALQREDPKLKGIITFKSFIWWLLFVALIEIATWLLMVWLLPTWKNRAEFGEMFEISHSLFSGLAFVGLIYTLLIQQNEIRIQRVETQRAAFVQEQLLNVLAVTAQLNAQYSLLDSRNREYDRSIENDIPKNSLSEKRANLEEIEGNISKTINGLNELISTLKR